MIYLTKIKLTVFLIVASILLGCQDEPKQINSLKSATCSDLTQQLKDKDAFPAIETMLDKNCPILYKNKWITDTPENLSKEIVDGCPEAWKSLAEKKILKQAKFYVLKSCATK